MTPIPYYLHPQQARDNLVASRLHRIATKIRRARVQHTMEAFKSIGYDDKAARELAEIHVKGL